ncbi:type II secretion system protein GspM [Neptunomonas sp. XY-337]|uniref:type II secretion system protein GspM n=1 Tax=Neptunomonas sp. XY-337 TaxID=2561897 RepID=UPI0010AA4992|nr:type II secretion system protein GspM [Neptunomonas sp. XY-337]
MINQMAERFNGLSTRERVLVFVSVLVILALLLFVVLIEPVMKRSAQIDNQLAAQQRASNARQVQISALSRMLKEDPSIEVRAQIEGLVGQQTELQEIIRERSQYLVAPSEVAPLIEQVLERESGVKLLKFSSLPVQQLQLTSAADIDTPAAEESAQGEALDIAPVYMHGFEVTLEGDYNGVYAYLLQLESLPQAFFWEQMSYQVAEHPSALVTLRIYTLSISEAWIGG